MMAVYNSIVWMCHDLIIPDTVYLNSSEPLAILSNVALTNLLKKKEKKNLCHIADYGLREIPRS